MNNKYDESFYRGILTKIREWYEADGDGCEEFYDFIQKVRSGHIGRDNVKNIAFSASDIGLTAWQSRRFLDYIKENKDLHSVFTDIENQKQKDSEEIKHTIKEASIRKIDPYVFLEEAIRQQEFKYDVEKPQKNNVKITLRPDSNGYMVALADLHFGSPWVSYPLMIDACRLLEKYGINIILLGDLRQNFIRNIKNNYMPVTEQSITPQQQFLFAINLIRHWIDLGLLKLLVRGNHDMRESLLTGMDFFNAIDWTIPVLHNRCEVTVCYGGQEWSGVVTHKEDGRSESNPNHAAGKALRNKYPSATFIINAHYHMPGYQEIPYDGRMVPLIQLGCFNQDDIYSRTTFGNKPFIFCPILKFVPGVDTPLYFRGFYRTNEDGSSINGYEKLMGEKC